MIQTRHLNRGRQIVCAPCSRGDCAECVGIDGAVRCHCTDCQRPCSRKECTQVIQQRIVTTEQCGDCFTVKSLTGACNCP